MVTCLARPTSSPSSWASVFPLESSVIFVANIVIGIILYFACIRTKNNSPPVVYESQAQTTARQTFELTRDEPTL